MSLMALLVAYGCRASYLCLACKPKDLPHPTMAVLAMRQVLAPFALRVL